MYLSLSSLLYLSAQYFYFLSVSRLGLVRLFILIQFHLRISKVKYKNIESAKKLYEQFVERYMDSCKPLFEKFKMLPSLVLRDAVLS